MARLEQPTVGDMIKALQEFPPELPFQIFDLDTGWLLWSFKVERSQLDINEEKTDEVQLTYSHQDLWSGCK